MRILLAEDERKLASAIVAYLKQEKYDVDYVSDGSSALSALESGMYDMAILDIMMPEMDGFQVIRNARAAGIKIPFLVLSAKSEVDDKITGLDCGADVGTATLSCSTTGQSIKLGEKELRILEYMLGNQGQIMTRDQLAMKIWGFESEAEYNNVEVYMTFTRKKLAFIGTKVEIKAIRGLGYELREKNV